MATAQKRGFRLPWGSDPRHDELSTDDEAGGGSSDAGNRSNELGAGPFGVAGTADAGPTRVASQAVADATEPATSSDPDAAPLLRRDSWPANDRRTAGPLSGDRPLATIVRAAAAASAVAVGGAAPTASVETTPASRAADETVEPPADAGHAETNVADGSDDDAVEVVSDARIQTLTGEAPATEAITMPAVEAEPEAETSAHSTRLPAGATADVAPPVSPPAAPTTAGVRRDNPLVAGLVRAMRQAATTARDEVLATFQVDAEARAEALQAESTAAAEGLRKAADADIAAIKDWSRAELARVREETEARIADRKTRLVEEAEFEASDLQERLTDLKNTVAGFEADMAAFFETLLAEEDPARLAGLAERMPSPPPIAVQPADERELAQSAEADEPAPEAARVAEATPAPSETQAAEETQTAEATPAADDAPAAEALAAPESAAPESAAPESSAPESAAPEWAWPEDEPAIAARASGDHLDPDTAAAAEAEARVGLDVQTHVVVSGLSSVASIASFKAALVHGTGVSAVSVTAGTDGAVLYTVTHDGRVDFRQVVDSMAAFEARVVSDDGSTLSVTASEPAA